MILAERTGGLVGYFFMFMSLVIFLLFCHAGFVLNKEPFPQVYVNGVPIESIK